MFVAGHCQPTSGDPAPIPEPDPVPVCDDYVTPETAWISDVDLRPQSADLFARWTGCADDLVEVCWSGELDDRWPPHTELMVERYPQGTCDHDIAASMWIDLSHVRDAAEAEAADEVVLEIDGLEIPWTLSP